MNNSSRRVSRPIRVTSRFTRVTIVARALIKTRRRRDSATSARASLWSRRV